MTLRISPSSVNPDFNFLLVRMLPPKFVDVFVRVAHREDEALIDLRAYHDRMKLD
jgi:hypothetical protein